MDVKFHTKDKSMLCKCVFTLADVGGIQRFIVRSIKSGLALIAVNALSVVTTVLADTSSLVKAVNVQRFA